MKYVLKALFRPLANRHYNGKKRSAILYAVNFGPAIAVCLVGAISGNPIFWTFLLVLIAFGFIDYVLFDGLIDKQTWKLFWRNFYADEVHEPTAHYTTIKNYESNPTAENYERLRKHLNIDK